jgi:hypothetical protein
MKPTIPKIEATSRRMLEWTWQRNEGDLRVIYGAVAKGITTAEAYESRIGQIEREQDVIEWWLGQPDGPPPSRRWSGMR